MKYAYTFLKLNIWMNNIMLAIRLNIITILPTKVKCSVKNTKHHSIFRIPLMIRLAIIPFGIGCWLIHILRTIAKVIYITLHTIGITILGIHWLGVTKELNQSIPKLTNTLPKTATIAMLIMINMILLKLFVFIL